MYGARKRLVGGIVGILEFLAFGTFARPISYTKQPNLAGDGYDRRPHSVQKCERGAAKSHGVDFNDVNLSWHGIYYHRIGSQQPLIQWRGERMTATPFQSRAPFLSCILLLFHCPRLCNGLTKPARFILHPRSCRSYFVYYQWITVAYGDGVGRSRG